MTTISYISPQKSHNCLAVILVGGKGKRLGGCFKSLLQVHNQPIIDHQLKVTQKIAKQTILVGTNKSQFSLDRPQLNIWPDLYGNHSPLSGIKTALYASSVPWIWIFANDLPFITVDACHHLSQQCDFYYKHHHKYPLIIFYRTQFIQPLAALWHRDAFTRLYGTSGKHTSLQHLCQQMPHLALSLKDPHILHNINTIEDLKNIT
jgi:molybdopterin-guanine dinucleotide biosynthesis protein A